MPYSWKDEAAKEGPANAPRIPAGRHELQISKLVFGSKTGGFFSAKDGSRQIMVIFTDSVNREANIMVTLSEKAAWVLAKILEAAGANLAKMQEAGIEPSKFTDERFATANLVGRKLMADVTWSKGNDGKEYADITPLRPGTATPPAAKQSASATAVNPEEIPF